MTPRDFCYWLQCYFELSGSNWNSPEGLENVLRHLELVKATPGDYDPDMVSFLGWLESAIEFGASQEKVQEKLSSIFEHVIDKNNPDDSYYQNQIHNSDKSNVGVFKMSVLGFYVEALDKFSNKVIRGVVVNEAELSEVYVLEDLEGVNHYSEKITTIFSDTELPQDTLRYINDNIRPKLYFSKVCPHFS